MLEFFWACQDMTITLRTVFHLVLLALVAMFAGGQAEPPAAVVDPALRLALQHDAAVLRGLAATAGPAQRLLPRYVSESLPDQAPGFLDVFLEFDGPLPLPATT